MPTFRIVYVEDDTFAPRTLTASFHDRATAEIAMAKHGHRVVHIAALDAGESPADPVRIEMAAAASRPEAAAFARRERAAPHRVGLARFDLAGAAIAVVGLAAAGAAIFLF